MKTRRNRNAWIWVAFAALTLASLARAEDSPQSSKASASPVLAFFSGSHAAQSASLHSAMRPAQPRLARALRTTARDGFAGTWIALLPVFFVGLVSPLSPLSTRAILCPGGVPSVPLLPSSFQRPPPSQFA